MPLAHPTDTVASPPSDAAAASTRSSVLAPLRGGGWTWSGALAWLMVLYGVGAAVLLGLGLWRGDTTWWLYLSNLSAFYWLAPAIPMVVVAALRRWWTVTAVCTVGTVAWLATFGPMYVPQSVTATDTLRIASYNISPQPDIEHVAHLVDRVRPDVLLVQELLPEAQDDLVDVLPSLPYHDFSPVNTSAPGGGGTAVLSRLPIVGSQPVDDLPADSRPANIVTLGAGDGAVAVVSLHLTSPCGLCTDEDPLPLLEQGLASEAETRHIETERVAEALPPGPVVVGGDLNSSTLNTPRRLLLREGLVDLHRAVGSGAGFTRDHWRGRFRIDWLLANRDVTPVREWVDQQQHGSDHSPVVADVELP